MWYGSKNVCLPENDENCSRNLCNHEVRNRQPTSSIGVDTVSVSGTSGAALSAGIIVSSVVLSASFSWWSFDSATVLVASVSCNWNSSIDYSSSRCLELESGLSALLSLSGSSVGWPVSSLRDSSMFCISCLAC